MLNRQLYGDPVWMFLITASGGMKSELLRAFRVHSDAYTLDLLTPHTFARARSLKNMCCKGLIYNSYKPTFIDRKTITDSSLTPLGPAYLEDNELIPNL